MDWLQCVRHFISIADRQSFSKVARQHYTSASALSKQMNWLEDQLGVALLARSTRHVGLTQAGERFYPTAKAWLDQFEQFKYEFHQCEQSLSGKLVVMAPTAYGESVLSKQVIAFMQQHPQLSVEVILCNQIVDLEQAGIDVAISIDLPTSPRYAQTLIARKNRVVAASPEYLAQHSPIKQPEDLLNHQCLIHKDYDAYMWQFKDSKRLHVNGLFHSNNVITLIQACLQGLGIIYTSTIHTSAWLATQQLESILEEYLPDDPWPIYAIYPKRMANLQKIKQFIQFINEQNVAPLFQST